MNAGHDPKASGSSGSAEKSMTAQLAGVVTTSLKSFGNVSATTGLLLWIITTLQSFGAVFGVSPGYWNDQYTGWLAQIADAILLRRYTVTNVYSYYAVWAIFGGILFLLTAVEVLRRLRSRSWNGILIRLANALFHLIAGVGYLPASAMLGSVASCQTTVDSVPVPIDQCWSDNNVALPLFGLIAFLAVSGMAVIKAMFLVEQIAIESQYLSKAHGRLAALHAVVSGALMFMSAVMSAVAMDGSDIGVLYYVAATVTFGALAMLQLKFAAYYVHWVQLFKTIATSLVAWFSFSALMLRIFSPSGFEAGILMYVCGLLAAVMCYLVNSRRQRYLIDADVAELSYDYEVEIKCRLTMLQRGDFWNRDSTNTAKLLDTHNDSYKIADEIFKAGLQRHPNSAFLHLAYGNFLFGKRNLNYCLTMLDRGLRSTQMSADFSFCILRRHDQVRAIFDAQRGTGEIKRYFRFLALSKDCDSVQQSYVISKLAFLSEIIKPLYNVNKINTLVMTMYEDICRLQDNYREMFALNMCSKVLRQYASFVSNILGHSEATKAIVEKADRLDATEKAKTMRASTRTLETQEALFDDSNAVFVLSGKEANLGEILDVNAGGVELFKFAVSTEMVGTNINTLMPSPFAELHAGYLKRFLSSGTSSVLNVTRTVYARTKIGYIFEVKLFVRQIVVNGEISLVGAMMRTKEQPELIITDNAGQLVAISENCRHLFRHQDEHFSVTTEDYVQSLGSVHISEWFGDKVNFEQLIADGQAQADLDQERRMHLKGINLSGFGSDYRLIEIWVETMEAEESLSRDNLAPLPDVNRVRESPTLMKRHTDSLLVAPSNMSHQGSAISCVTDVAPMSASMDLTDNANTAAKNAAMNVVTRFDTNVRDYRATLNASQYRSFRRASTSFKYFGIALLVWLLATSLIFNNLLQGLKNSVDELKSQGIRTVDSLRVRTNSRTIQILSGCTSGYVSPVCAAVSNESWTLQTRQEISHAMSNAQHNYVDANYNMFSSLAAKSTNPALFDPLASFITAPTTGWRLRGMNNINQYNTSLLGLVMDFSRSSAFMTSIPPLFSFQTVKTVPRINSTDGVGYLSEPNPQMWRSMFFINENVLAMMTLFEGLNEVYELLFNTQVGEVQSTLMILSIIPTACLIVCVLIFMVPGIVKMVRWHAGAVSTVLNIPRMIVHQWHRTFVQQVESTAREEEGMNAEVYMYLQKEGTNPDIMGDHGSKKVSKIAGTADSKQEKVMLTPVTAFNSLKQTRSIVRLVVCVIVLGLVPLGSLLMLPTLMESRQVHYQMRWSNLVMGKMYRFHYVMRETYLMRFSGMDTAAARLHARNELDDYLLNAQYFVSGDPSNGLSGLNSKPNFYDVLVNDACSMVTQEFVDNLVLTTSCKDFEQGLLTHGLVTGLIEYGNRAKELDLLIENPATTARDVAPKLAAIERLGKQICSIILSISPLISDEITALSSTNSNVIQPIQLVLAFVVLVYMYFYIYAPFLSLLDRVTKSTHAMLMLLWSSTDGSGANSIHGDLDAMISLEGGSASGVQEYKDKVSTSPSANISDNVELGGGHEVIVTAELFDDDADGSNGANIHLSFNPETGRTEPTPTDRADDIYNSTGGNSV